MFLEGHRSLARDLWALLPDFYEDTTRAQCWQELQRSGGTDTDCPAQIADSGVELRNFLG